MRSPLRRPFVRYSSLLHGPNQDTEDPTFVLRSHLYGDGRDASLPTTTPLFRRKAPETAEESDKELESLSQQFRALQESIRLELMRPRPVHTEASHEDEESRGAQSDDFVEHSEAAVSPTARQGACEEVPGSVRVEEIDDTVFDPSDVVGSSDPTQSDAGIRSASSDVGSGSALSGQLLDDSLRSIFSAVRDSLRGAMVPPRGGTHRSTDADSLRASKGNDDDNVESTATELMRYVASLSTSGFFRVNSVATSSQVGSSPIATALRSPGRRESKEPALIGPEKDALPEEGLQESLDVGQEENLPTDIRDTERMLARLDSTSLREEPPVANPPTQEPSNGRLSQKGSMRKSPLLPLELRCLRTPSRTSEQRRAHTRRMDGGLMSASEYREALESSRRKHAHCTTDF